MDARDTAQQVRGFGAHIWSGDRHVEPILKRLGLRYVRMTVGPNWIDVKQQPPTDAGRDEMDRYLADHFDADGESRLQDAKKAWRMIDRLKLEVIMLQFSAPEVWLSKDGKRWLLPEHVDDYARYWGTLVVFMARNGMRPTYVELSNEPEGDWNTYISPEDYNRLVILTRKELDDRGFQDIGILGPGLAYLDHDDGGKQWIGALDDEAVQSLAGWSTHVWDDVFEPDAPVGFVVGRWHDFKAAVRDKDPQASKPIIITEYATAATTFNGVTYGPVESDGKNPASDSFAYAQRVFELTLVHINQGASVLVLWQAADQPWSVDAWGFATGTHDKKRRPVFHAMKTLLPLVPENALAIKQTWDDPDLTIAGLVGDSRLIVALANGTDQPQQRAIRLLNVDALTMKSATRYHEGRVEEVDLSMDGHTFRVNLPAESTLTCDLIIR